MVPLDSLQDFLTWIFINPSDETTTKNRKIMYAAIGSVVFVFQIIGFAASLAYSMKFMSVDLEESVYCIFQIIALLTGAFSFLFSCISRRKIKVIFENLSDICNKSKP